MGPFSFLCLWRKMRHPWTLSLILSSHCFILKGTEVKFRYFQLDMSKKKKKSTAADDLIESLMDDLQDIQSESSFNSGVNSKYSPSADENFAGLPTLDSDDNRVENTNPAANIWKELEQAEIPPAGDYMAGVPPSEQFGVGKPSEESVSLYKGPSSGMEYQTPDDIFSPGALDATKPVMGGEDKTVSIQQDLNVSSSVVEKVDADKTLAVEGFANARVGGRRTPDMDVKVSVGHFRGGRGSANVLTSMDASLAQAENLKLAQQRILDLEKEVEQLRGENEELASAGEIVRSRMDELAVRISNLEKEKTEQRESAQSEMLILKGNLQYKENEVAKARLKVDELETRLKSDFKKIRVRERELENRLELLRAEKTALVQSKDEYILEQKRKIDQLSQELDNYRRKCLELNKTIEANQEQVKRTERALRLALTNLEAKEENLVPLKKAE